MNIEKVNPDFINSAYLSKHNTKTATNKIGFTGNTSQAVIEKAINKQNTPILRGINKLRNNIGEFQDICINAIGTGFLAPIFIKHNPLSKTDEDTRTYSAWRQPVSAGLAIATQGLITIPVVKIIKNMANNGYLGEECNLTPFRDTSYIEKLMKKMHPNANKKELNNFITEYLKSNNGDLQSTIASLKDDNTVYYTVRNFCDKQKKSNNGEHQLSKRVKMDPKKYSDLLNRTVDDMIKNEQIQLNRYEQEKYTKRLAQSEYYRTNSKEALDVLNEMKTKINGSSDVKNIKKELKAQYKALKSNKANPHLLSMVEETIALAAAGKEDMLEKVNKMEGHVHKHMNKTPEEVKNAVKASVKERIDAHKGAIEFLNRVKDAIKDGKTVSQIEEMFAKEVDDYHKKAVKLNLENKESRLKDKKFSFEVANKLKTLTNKHIEGVKRISTLIAALAILPVSCSLLNWIYPRFMDAFFPKLSSKKHNNESKELINNANKNSEVK